MTNKPLRYVGCPYKAAVRRAGFHCNTSRLLYHGSLISNKHFSALINKIRILCNLCIPRSSIGRHHRPISRQTCRSRWPYRSYLLFSFVFFCCHNVSDNVNEFCLFFQCLPSSATFVSRQLATAFVNRSQMLAIVATK